MGKKKRVDPNRVEAATQKIGRDIWDHLERRQPSIFERRWWDDRILSTAMADESVKVQMFRFVDVLPMLRTHEDISRHLHEYFEEVRKHLPWAVRLGLDLSQPNTILGRALALNARSNATRMAKRFIAGAEVDEVLQTVARIRKQGYAFTLDLLGEAVLSEAEADRYQQQYLDLIAGLAPTVNAWPQSMTLDTDHDGPIPRVNVSVKLSALYSQFNPADPEGTAKVVKSRLRPILQAAREHNAYIHVDMEQYAYKNLTLEIFKQVLMEKEFRDFPDAGIVIQTYLPDAEQDLMALRDWAKKRKTPITVRLVKGAYWDYETVVSRYNNWPVPVYQQKWQSDDNYEKQARFLMENHKLLKPALASHNMRSLANGLALAQELKVPTSAYEIQMLYGMGGDVAQLLMEREYRVRIYTPFGELIPGMAYLVRRLLENTSNDSFLRQSFTEHVAVEDLMMKPTDVGSNAPVIVEDEPRGFENEAPTDFSQAEARTAMREALSDVKSEFGQEYLPVISGRVVDARSMLVSRNPGKTDEVVGQVGAASADDAVDAIVAARQAYREWSRTNVKYRAEYLQLVAAEMRNRRFELASWICYECGKPWAEADGDVAEAIDFCEYYAYEMQLLDKPRHIHHAGEDNTYYYRPRGVAVIIAPWNFPLAILTGMTVANLVAGNTVVMKPAEQSSVVAAKLMSIFQTAGFPSGTVNLLPGIGEDLGPELVGNPDVDVIAFTGSRDVGLAINEAAASHDDRQGMVKRVVAEMGGKNAIIIDDDADLDEAVIGVRDSAFGYAGQKCSACSRVVVLDRVYDAFLERLVDATKSLKVGQADDPATKVGPVIDEDSFNRIKAAIADAMEDEDIELALGVNVGKLADSGYFIGPHIFSNVDPGHSLAQNEIFGPVLSVIRANDLDDALDVANDSQFALTGGFYSRSPANLKKVRQGLNVGNLYLNRSITGALVDRHPFGGYKLSGIGSKAGGPDYLQQFLIPVNVTENTMRRGFAPESS